VTDDDDDHGSQTPRFSKTARPYSAKDVCLLRGTIELTYPSDTMGKKLVSRFCSLPPHPQPAASRSRLDAASVAGSDELKSLAMKRLVRQP
jgi:hypothetical protein